MSKKLFTFCVLPLFLLVCNSSEKLLAQPKDQNSAALTGTLEKMVVQNGVVTMDVDLKQLTGATAPSAPLRFTVAPDSFFTLLVFNNVLRTPLPSSMALAPQGSGASLPAALKSSLNQLVIEKTAFDEAFELVVRDAKTGFVFFNVDGHGYDYDASKHLFSISGGRLLVSEGFAKQLGHASLAGSTAGKISIVTTVSPMEIDKVVNGAVESAKMPALHQPAVGTVPGPDVIVGDVLSISQRAASVGGFVGLGIGTTSCNAGTIDLDWMALPNNDHPVIPQNLYRMSGGTSNTERFEQIGQSYLKHAFTALTENICGYGCNNVGGSHLGSGCSDPYVASLNDGGTSNSLGSRAWVNPFTGSFPGSSPSPNDHTGHAHTGTSHRVLVAVSDMNNTLNPGATYFGEGQYVTPHEYAWCQAHPGMGQCNMYNNVSYRQFTITGTTTFTYTTAGVTQRTKPAINAWTGASLTNFEPAPGADGIGIIGWKVTNPSAGVWHYEYAVYNQNMDRAIQSFSVPKGCAVGVSNLGFHMPPQHPAWANDGTVGSAGYSSTPWAPAQTASSLTWNCETFAQNQNANAIRWGTLYNFRFDSDHPPVNANATIGFFKTGSPITVAVQAPMPEPCNPLQITSVVSRKVHNTAGTFDIDLPLSGGAGVECRSTDGNHQFVFTFSNNVASGNASVTGGIGAITGTPTFSGNTMTVNLSGVDDDQQITVTASSVMDTFGQTLPDTGVDAIILMGDANGNASVNASDVAMTKGAVGSAVDSSNFRADVNANGVLSASDVTLVKSNIGKAVP